MFNQGLRVVVEPFGEMEFSLEDVLIDHEGIIVCEGVDARNHFIDENSKGPPVHWFSVTLVLQNLRR